MIKLNKSLKNTFKEYQFMLQPFCDYYFVKYLIPHFNSFIKVH